MTRSDTHAFDDDAPYFETLKDKGSAVVSLTPGKDSLEISREQVAVSTTNGGEVKAGLDGPSKTITVEPVEQPLYVPEEAPEPAKEPEKV